MPHSARGTRPRASEPPGGGSAGGGWAVRQGRFLGRVPCRARHDPSSGSSVGATSASIPRRSYGGRSSTSASRSRWYRSRIHSPRRSGWPGHGWVSWATVGCSSKPLRMRPGHRPNVRTTSGRPKRLQESESSMVVSGTPIGGSGHRAEGAAAQGRGRCRWLEGRDHLVDVLSTRRRGHDAEGDGVAD